MDADAEAEEEEEAIEMHSFLESDMMVAYQSNKMGKKIDGQKYQEIPEPNTDTLDSPLYEKG